MFFQPRIASCFLLLGILTSFLIPHPAAGMDAPRQSPVGGEYVADEVLIAFEPGQTSTLHETGLAAMPRPAGPQLMVLKVPPGTVLERAAALSRVAGVRFAQPNWIYHPQGDPDPDLRYQWALHNPGAPFIECDGADCPLADADIDWPQAVMLLENALFSPATLAIIDTGINAGHPDLAGKLAPGYDFIDQDGLPDDQYGHGTHVAGIAAALTYNSRGIGGVAFPDAIRIMPLKVCDGGGSCPDSAITAAIYWAIDNGAAVINMSLGNGSYSPLMEEALNAAWEAGVIVVAAAGNNAANRVSYPGAYNHVLAVGATTWTDRRARYSNYGPRLDMVAPGGEMSKAHDPGGIYSTTPTYRVSLSDGARALRDHYDYLSGTSMSSPQVAGAAALLKSLWPHRSHESIIETIKDTADDLGAPGIDEEFGSGRLNICRALGGSCAAGDDPYLPPSIWPPDHLDTPTPTSWQVLKIPIRASGDDSFSYYSRGWVNAVHWEDLILKGETWGGLRFVNLPIPRGSEIVAATLSLNVFRDDDPNLRFYAEAADHAGSFFNAPPQERLRSTTAIHWQAQNIGGGWQLSVDLAPLIQGVIDRPGWSAGNAAVLILENQGGQLRFRSWDYDFGRTAAILELVYAPGNSSLTSTAAPTATLAPAMPTWTASPTQTAAPPSATPLPPTATPSPLPSPTSTPPPPTATPSPLPSPTSTPAPPSATATAAPQPTPTPDAECTPALSRLDWHARFTYPSAETLGYLPQWLGDRGGSRSIQVSDQRLALRVLALQLGSPYNGISHLYAQLLSTRLNLAAGSRLAPIEATVIASDDFLARYYFLDWSRLSKNQRSQVAEWVDTLEAYNLEPCGGN